MAELMQKAPAPRLPLAPAPGFAPWETQKGIVHRRCRTWNADHWIGCVPVSAALTASADYWALLSLEPAITHCNPRGALFLDTETTGLGAGAGVLAFLVGLAWFDEQERIVLEQLFLRSPAEEAAQLELITERLATATLLVTFNGKSFDWPLLVTRFVMNRMPVPRLPQHLDLLHVARRLHKPRLNRVTLKSLETEVLALDRGPDIDGSEIGPRYSHYLRTFDEEALRPVIDHNAVDVLSMVALVGLYGEPLERLHEGDWVSLGRTFKRARAFDKAQNIADLAVQHKGGPEARRLRAELAKARGDRDTALRDFEQLCECVDDPKVRLELAKLYEHHVKQPERALEYVERGTGESEAATQHRRKRLQSKSVRAAGMAKSRSTGHEPFPRSCQNHAGQVDCANQQILADWTSGSQSRFLLDRSPCHTIIERLKPVGSGIGTKTRHFKPAGGRGTPSTTRSTCFPIRPAMGCTSGTPRVIPRPISLRATR